MINNDLKTNTEKIKNTFLNGKPYPYVIIDDFLEIDYFLLIYCVTEHTYLNAVVAIVNISKINNL